MTRARHYIVRRILATGHETEVTLPHNEPYVFTAASNALEAHIAVYGGQGEILLVTPRGTGGRVTLLKRFK